MGPRKRLVPPGGSGCKAAFTLAVLAMVAAAAPADGAEGPKTISIRPDGTIVTSRNGKVVEVDRRTLSAPPPGTKAKPRVAKAPASNAPAGTASGGAAAASSGTQEPGAAPTSVPHSLRTPPEPSPAATHTAMTWLDLARYLLIFTSLLVFFASYCLLLVAGFQQSSL
jgi:hypothetical protein